MNEGLIPRRYAKALLAYARENDADGRLYSLMRQLELSFEATPGMQKAMMNPFVSIADKKALVTTAMGLGDNRDEIVDNFLTLLADRGRLNQIRAIALAYISLYREANNIYDVKVTSAAPLGQPELDRIRTLVGRHLGPGATLEFSDAVDPSLIGGFTISVGNERLDASIANDFKRLRQAMLSNS